MGKQAKSQQKEFFPSWLKLYHADPTILGQANLQALSARFYHRRLNCLNYSEKQAADRFFQTLIPKADNRVPLLPQLRQLDHFKNEKIIVVHLKNAEAKRHFVIIDRSHFILIGRQIICSHEGQSFEVDVLSPFVFTWSEYQFIKKNRKYTEIMVKAFRRKSVQFAVDKFLVNLQQSKLVKEKRKSTTQLSVVPL